MQAYLDWEWPGRAARRDATHQVLRHLTSATLAPRTDGRVRRSLPCRRGRAAATSAEEIPHRACASVTLYRAETFEPLPDDQAIDVERGSRRSSSSVATVCYGNEGNAQSGDHGLLDGFVAAHRGRFSGECRRFRTAVPSGRAFPTGLARQEGFAGKLVRRDARFPRQTMSGPVR